MLDKLAGEYADELGNLGVRVSNLEKKVETFPSPATAVSVFSSTMVTRAKP